MVPLWLHPPSDVSPRNSSTSSSVLSADLSPIRTNTHQLHVSSRPLSSPVSILHDDSNYINIISTLPVFIPRSRPFPSVPPSYCTLGRTLLTPAITITTLRKSHHMQLPDIERWTWVNKGRINSYIGKGYIPKVFAFKNLYPLNPKKSYLFYFLLICTKWPKPPKFQRVVSSSSELRAIQCIPRDNTTLTFLLIIRRKNDTRGMRKSVLSVPSVLDFALTV